VNGRLLIVVPGAIVGKNEAKGLNFKRKQFFIPKPMKLWMRRVAVCAHAAAVAADWPDPFMVREASYRIFRYNVGGDFDRGNTYLVDALQFTRWWTPRGLTPIPGPIGLVGNDKALWCAGSPPTITDDEGPRVEVHVELRAMRAPHEADELRRRWYVSEARRKAKKSAKNGEVRASAAAKRSRDELAQVEANLGIRLPL
jgi:hypothetical protein